MLWSVLWTLQCCQFLWKGFNSLASHLRGGRSSSVGSNYYVIYLCQYLFQLNFDNKKQNLDIAIDYTMTNNFCVICCFGCGKSAFRWHDLHRGDVFTVKTFNEGAQPGRCAGSYCRLSFHSQRSHGNLPPPLCDGGKEGVGVTWIFDHFGRRVPASPQRTKPMLVMPFIINSGILRKCTLLT